MSDIVILGGARTAVGTFGGSLANTPPIELATAVSKAAIERAGVQGDQIGHVAFGHVINTEPRDMYLSRVASVEAGRAKHHPGDEREPPLRLRPSGNRVRHPVSDAGRCGFRTGRWCRKHVPLPLHPAAAALGPEDG